ncbi:MAG: hypothetical protein IT249_06550 [Chitinophagaceae bacterium]|nr:hypothetical protein [Chitinophagaceae bacterium]
MHIILSPFSWHISNKYPILQQFNYSFLKKIFAILLLFVHVFNLAGYTLLFGFLQQQNTKTTLAQIENGQYSDKDLILVKVPMVIPYSTNWKDYERYDGEIEWGGVHYNYVKRKLQNDTLYVLCLPNTVQTNLHKAQKQYADHVNDLPSQKKNDSCIKKVSLAGEYDQHETVYFSCVIPYQQAQQYMAFSSSLLHEYSHCIIQPPDAIA